MSLYATTSQTVGPYLHIGLTWLIREDLVGARCHRRARHHRGTRPRRRRQAGQRRAGRDLAGERPRQVRAPGGQAGEASRAGFQGFGRSATDDNGRVPLHDRQAGTGARARRRAAGAAHRGLGVHARPAEAARSPGSTSRTSRATRTIRSSSSSRPSAGRRWSREASRAGRARWSGTSCSRARKRLSSSTSSRWQP